MSSMRPCVPRTIRSAGMRYGDAAGMSCSGPIRRARCRPAIPCARRACHWPYDPGLRFEVPLLPAERAMSLSIPTSDGVTPMARIGCVQLPPPLEAVIDVWWLRQYAGGLFLPLRDGTAGQSSYGGGRYAARYRQGRGPGRASRRLIIDLNFLYHPSCRYNDAGLACPLAPPGNTISTPVSAGERLPPDFGLPVVGLSISAVATSRRADNPDPAGDEVGDQAGPALSGARHPDPPRCRRGSTRGTG